MNVSYHTPNMKWQYQYFIVINDYEYSFGDRVPMPKNLEGAQRAMTTAVETHPHIPVNIIGPLKGKFVSETRFVGKVMYADDLDDGSDFDTNTKRYVDVEVSCIQVRKDTVIDK